MNILSHSQYSGTSPNSMAACPTVISPTNNYFYHIQAVMVVQSSPTLVSVALTILVSAGYLTITDTPSYQTHLMTFLVT